MNRCRQFSCFFSAIGLLILILDGKTALSGAVSGIELCIETVIPALFPFFVLSAVILRGAAPVSRLEGLFSSVFGFPQGAGSLVLPCLLGGYPVGARSVFQAYSVGTLNKQEAERMLAFCNNAGPAFVFGVLSQFFPKNWMPWALWVIHLVGARVAAFCFPCTGVSALPEEHLPQSKGRLIPDALLTMGTVCGWIILFRVLISFLDRWLFWLFPQTVRVFLVGVLELTNGCCELQHVSSLNARFILCSGMLAAGGLCVTAQTVSVTPGLSLYYYFLGKIIQILVSLVLSYSLIFHSIPPLILLLLPILHRGGKKRCSNHMLSGV